jgi:putrescine aminotransferase
VDKNAVLQELDRVLSYVASDKITKEDAAVITQDTIDNYYNYFNTGYMDFRKSITPDGATIEWNDTPEHIVDVNGTPYIDCIGGFGTYICGHRNPEILRYVKKQMDRLTLSSTELLEPLRGYLCKVLAMITPGDLQYSYLTNGGAEAVEMALKMAVLFNGPGYFISTVRGFHGKSMGAVSMTGNADFRRPYLPMIQQVQHIEYGNASALETAIRNLQAVGEKVTAFIIEPVQGEAGCRIPPLGYLKAVREICDRYGVVLIADEIQTGFGRTGYLWRCNIEDVTPDILVFGKISSGGIIPITGIVSRKHIFEKSGLADNPFILGSPTFGGNALACSSTLATINYILKNDIPKMAADKGDYFMKYISQIQARHHILTDLRGAGLLIAMEFETSDIGYEVSKEIFARKVLVAGTLNNAKVIRIEPPAILSYEHIDTVLQVLEESISAVEKRL